MKLILKPNYKEFSFQQLVDFYNKYLGKQQNIYLDFEGDKCYLFQRGSVDKGDEISEYTLRLYFADEVEKENINCLDFFNEK